MPSRFSRRDAFPGQSQMPGKSGAKNRPLSVQFNPQQQQQVANGVPFSGEDKEGSVLRVSQIKID